MSIRTTPYLLFLLLSIPLTSFSAELSVNGKIVAIDCKAQLVSSVRPKDKGYCVVAYEGATSSQSHGINKWIAVSGFATVNQKLKLEETPNLKLANFGITINDSQITKIETAKTE